ncbi:MAG: gliding motility-associated C-terminal domain-containing protein [Chitinophagales bacterium]
MFLGRKIVMFSWLFIYNLVLFAQPSNDACINAIHIANVSNYCSSVGGGTTVGATDDASTTGGFSPAGCWGSGAVNDVWYSFTAIASDISITVKGNEGVPSGGTLNRPQVALYGGSCSGTINEMVCGSAPSGQNIIQIYRGGLTIGQTYLIRVDGLNSNKGSFQLCVNNFNPVPTPEGDCPSAVILCDKSGFTVPAVSGVGSIATEMNDATCFDYDPSTGNIESSSTWYVFTFSTSGTFTFNITPSNIDDDIDFALYLLPNGVGNCAGKQTVRCMAASCYGSTGLNTSSSDISEPPGCSWSSDNYVKQVNVTAGQTYALAINNFTSTGNGFGITFGGTSTFQGPTATIIDSDADDKICIGESINFSQTSSPPTSGTLVAWNWNFGVDATPATFVGTTPPPITYSSNGIKTISLTVESDRGCLFTVTKNITVSSTPPVLSIVASQNPVCQGSAITFTATASNAGTNPTIQWYLNNNPVGTNSTTYTNSSLNNGDVVKARVTSNLTCNFGSQTTSNSITVQITNPKPVSVTISGDNSICQGDALTLTAQPTNGGTSPIYQWFVNGNPSGTNSNTFSSLSINNGDIITVSLTSNLTCVSGNPATSANFNVIVNPKPTLTASNPTICSGQSATLSISGATSYTWTGGLAPIANPTTPILTTNATYTVTGTLNGCKNTKDITVNVKPNPTVSVNSPKICEGQKATLTASGATSYSWNGGLPAVAQPTTPTLTTTTTYEVIGITNGCKDSATAIVTVNPKKTTNISKTICANESVTIGNQTFNTNGTHTVTLSTSENCDSVVILDLTVTTPITPKITITANKTSICNNEEVIFKATTQNTLGNITYKWVINGSDVGVNDSVFTTRALKNGDVVHAEISLSNTTCVTSFSATSNSISIISSLPNYTIPNVQICPEQNKTIDIGLSIPTYTVSWKNENDSLTIVNADTFNVHNSISGTAYFTVKYGDGCSVSDSIPIRVFDRPIVDATSDKTHVRDQEIFQLNADGNGLISYNWQPAHLVSSSTIKNPTATITESTIFTVLVKDNNQCENTDSVLVNFIEACSVDNLFFPTAFSPNNDGVNDCFGILSPPNLSQYKLVIFNRWGELVFETNNVNECWNGEFKGVAAAADSYVYVSSFVCNDGRVITKKGGITILR